MAFGLATAQAAAAAPPPAATTAGAKPSAGTAPTAAQAAQAQRAAELAARRREETAFVAAAVADAERRKLAEIPMGSWHELALGCRTVSAYGPMGLGCSFDQRIGETFYGLIGLGMGMTMPDGLYFFQAGGGFALWLDRKLNLHLEAGGGSALAGDDVAGVLFAGVGASYRLPSRPVAFGLDYRAEASNADRGGFGHSLGLSFLLRLENDREH